MKFEEVAKHFRRNATPLGVGKVVIISNDGDFFGRGEIAASNGRMELSVILDGNRDLPRIGGSITRDQFWKIGCIIEEQVPVWALGMPDQWNTQDALFSVRGGKFELDTLHHLTVPLRDGGLREAVMIAASTVDIEGASEQRFYASAHLSNFKLIWSDIYSDTVRGNEFLGKTSSTRRDTLRGEFDEFEYALIERDDDCEVHLRLKKGSVTTAGIVRDTFSALLQALAFLHGQHAWPQWERIETDLRVVHELTTAPRNVPKTIHTLLTTTTCANHSNAQSLIEKAVRNFLSPDDFSRSLANYMFLSREAAANETPFKVGTLGLCAAFEGVVGLLHGRFCEGDASVSVAEFRDVRAVLLSYAQEQRMHAASQQKPVAAWERLAGLVGSAQPLRIADRYLQLVEHFRLPWEDKMADALASWKSQRNPLAHGVDRDDADLDDLFHKSRIAGAINVLIGAALGYSGLAVLSRIEDQYLRLP